MPIPRFRHNCPVAGGRPVENVGRRCWKCFRRTELYEWQWGVIEHWARYYKRTRLSPLGAKPPELKDRQITRLCGRCNGEGLLGAGDGTRIPYCPDCDGAGGFPVLDEATLAYAREYARAVEMAKVTEWHLQRAAREKEEAAISAAAVLSPHGDH